MAFENELKGQILTQVLDLVKPRVIGATIAKVRYANADPKLFTEVLNGFANVAVGDKIEGADIPADTKVLSKESDQHITLDKNTTAASAKSITLNAAALAGATSLTVLATPVALEDNQRLVFYLNAATNEVVNVWVDGAHAAGVLSVAVHPVELAMDNSMVATVTTSTVVAKQTVATGNGSTSAYSGTITLGSGEGVHKGSVIITDGVETFKDDGEGNLVSDLAVAAGANGTINYKTGAYSVTFGTDVLNNVVISLDGRIGKYGNHQVNQNYLLKANGSEIFYDELTDQLPKLVEFKVASQSDISDVKQSS